MPTAPPHAHSLNRACAHGIIADCSSAVRAREGDTSDFYKRLAKVKTLTTFFPFDYSVNWSAEELEDVELGASITAGLNKEAEQLGIPLTVIHSGVFLDFFLEPSVVGVDLLNNKLALFGDALKRKIPVTRASYLGQAVAELVSGPKDKLPGTHYTVVEASWTGQEIADALEKVNGAKPQISEITDRALREDYDAAPESKALKRKWGAGEFPNPDPFNPKNVTPMNIDEMFAAIKKIRTTKIE